MREWHWWRDRSKRVVFFGMYHVGDYWRFIWHRGERTVFWTGSDILTIHNSVFWKYIISHVQAKHFCENEIEQIYLKECGIQAIVSPQCFESFDQFTPQKVWNIKERHVFASAHMGAKEIYGISLIEGIAAVVPEVIFHIYGVSGISHHNIAYHGNVPNEQFNEDIKKYHAGLRLNDFDGFGEILAKSILLGQYPISRIFYPFIDYAKDTTSLISLLKDLKNKKEPNVKAREYWLKQLNKTPFL